MLWCKDPLLTYLQSYGYNTLRLPRADLMPLQILGKFDRDLRALGNLSTILAAGPRVPLPTVSANVPQGTISGKQSGSLSIGIGLSLLGIILGAMGGSIFGLDEQYKQAKSATFAFQEVLGDSVAIAELDQYLGDADINPASKYLATLLSASELYVITAVIKSRTFSIETSTSGDNMVKLDVPAIQQIVGANIAVSAQEQSDSTITYQGQTLLGFGFQAVKLFYDQGHYTAFTPLPPAVALKPLANIPTDDGTEHLLSDSPLLRIDVA